MKGDKWRRETRSGSDFGNQHAGRQTKGDKWRRETRSGSDFGNQHAGRQMKGDKWRRETRSGSDFGNQHAGRQMKGDKWRRETRSGSDFGNQQPNVWEVRTPIASSFLGNEEGRLGAAAISVISMQGDKWRRETRPGSDFGNQHAGRQMKGDKWRRETRSGSDFGNQQPNLWEVRTPIASSYLGNEGKQMKKGD